ncbi:hypothetical protein LOTGIDRAFT_235611 [Lottia gigantea]|uniref:PDZ domain-containing protein n=1 Tax=Lottia gigantea TaxID=225164 RepID=V3ZNX6_LOTGI|nr:hypothetical protein LOTGIDRAFT_235611 [Lottia gigantea]ESO86017.1 hypothetical protein LOTGIDRAFT_235611 [Lottia gigantea]
MTEVKTGILSVQNITGKNKSRPIRLQLSADNLILQQEEWVTAALQEEDEAFLNMVRDVTIIKENGAGLGLCVKGGNEHNLPVLISRIIKGQAADATGKLVVGDSILKVNDVTVENANHDEVVKLLKEAGETISLTVKHFKPASHFLNRGNNYRKDSTEEERQLHIPGLPRIEKIWSNVVGIPLLYGRVSRYFPGTDKLRSNSFEVFGVDGASSGPVYCEDNRLMAEWIQAVTTNIDSLLNQMIQMTNRLLIPEEQIYHMCWTSEKMSADRHCQAWKAKFLSLKAADLLLFDIPPMHARDWSICEMKYKVYECMFKLLEDKEQPDDRQYCCRIQTGSGDDIVLSLESRAELLQLEKAWYRSNTLAIKRLVSKTFGCTWRGALSGLTIDLNFGFSLYDHETKSFMWTYKFSQLKSSSDDGKKKLVLTFNNENSKETETREIECTELRTLMYCIHSFLSAKLASIDPNFLANF